MGVAETTLKNRRRGRLKVVLIVLLVLLVFGTPVIIYFRISADGRIALREAKNIKLSFQMISIEYYAMGDSIYDNTRASGMGEGVRERIDEILELKGSIKITSYDTGNRVVTGFIYTTGSYQVIYTYDKTTGGSYRVNYIFKLFDFGE